MLKNVRMRVVIVIDKTFIRADNKIFFQIKYIKNLILML